MKKKMRTEGGKDFKHVVINSILVKAKIMESELEEANLKCEKIEAVAKQLSYRSGIPYCETCYKVISIGSGLYRFSCSACEKTECFSDDPLQHACNKTADCTSCTRCNVPYHRICAPETCICGDNIT